MLKIFWYSWEQILLEWMLLCAGQRPGRGPEHRHTKWVLLTAVVFVGWNQPWVLVGCLRLGACPAAAAWLRPSVAGVVCSIVNLFSATFAGSHHNLVSRVNVGKANRAFQGGSGEHACVCGGVRSQRLIPCFPV